MKKRSIIIFAAIVSFSIIISYISYFLFQAISYEPTEIPNLGNVGCSGRGTILSSERDFETLASFWVIRRFPDSKVIRAQDIRPKTTEPLSFVFSTRVRVKFYDQRKAVQAKILSIDVCGNLLRVEEGND